MNLFQGDDNNIDQSSDEDEKFFEEAKKFQVVAKIQEDIDGLIEKGKKRTLKYSELMERRKKK